MLDHLNPRRRVGATRIGGQRASFVGPEYGQDRGAITEGRQAQAREGILA
jgi:hypothetical protein